MTKSGLSGSARMLRDFPGLWYIAAIKFPYPTFMWSEFGIVVADKDETASFLSNPTDGISFWIFGTQNQNPLVEYCIDIEHVKQRVEGGFQVDYMTLDEQVQQNHLFIVHRYPRPRK